MSAIDPGWKVLLAAFPKWDLSRDAIAVWTGLLSDLDPDDLNKAAAMLATRSKFPPTIADWRECALAISGKGKVGRLTAAEAWDEMYRNRHSVSGKPPTWTSEAVKRAAEAIHWKDPDWLTEQIPMIRAQFRDAYNALADKADAIDNVNRTRETFDRLDDKRGDGPRRIGT